MIERITLRGGRPAVRLHFGCDELGGVAYEADDLDDLRAIRDELVDAVGWLAEQAWVERRADVGCFPGAPRSGQEHLAVYRGREVPSFLLHDAPV